MHSSIVNSIQRNPESVLFWTGAGISMDPPASLPSGYRLTKSIVEAFCMPDTWEIIISLLTRASFQGYSGKTKTVPRLEALLGSMVSILGYDFLSRFYTLDPIPNALHYFFAQHIKHNGRHVTLNLDLGIENAIRILFGDFSSPYLMHLHGSFNESPSALGLTFENLAKGLPDSVAKKALEAILKTDTVIFAGYSGSDYFDIDPFFEGLVGKQDLSSKMVIWIDYSDGDSGVVAYPHSPFNSRIMDSLHECGADVYVWTGPTRLFIEDLRKHWSFEQSIIFPSSGAIAPSFDQNISDWQRRLITAKVFVSMGIGNKALEIIKDFSELASEYSKFCMGQAEYGEMTSVNNILYIHNEAKREMGLYKDASKVTRRFQGRTELDIMLVYERRSSDDWLAGSWFSARKEFLEALEYGSPRLGKSYRFDIVYVETLRAYMQLCRDIGSLPIIGAYLLNRFILYPVDLIASNSKLQKILLRAPYDRAHIARLFSWEGKELQSIKRRLPNFLTNESVVLGTFDETDNLLGIINATRSKMLLDLSKGLSLRESEVTELIELSKAIGDNPGIVKACQILVSLGKIDKQTTSIFLRSLWRTQWIWIRKLQELMKFLRSLLIGMVLASSSIRSNAG